MRTSSCAALGAIAHYAKVTPQAPALIDPDGLTLSYKESWAQIEAVNGRLREAGIHPGRRVAVLLPQGLLQVLAVLGVLHEHVAIPLQARTTAFEVESHLDRLSVSALITSQEFMQEAEAATRSGIAVLIVGKGKSPDQWQLRVPDVVRSATAETNDAILFLITSATTGNSKIVPLSSANLDAGNASTRDAAQLTSADRLLLMVSLCHRLGMENALAQLLVGGAVIASGGFDPSTYFHWLNNLRPTWYVCAPTVHQGILAQLRNEHPSIPHSLRLLQSAGAPLPREVRQELEEILRVPVLNGYGATEAHYIAIEAFPPIHFVPDAAGRSCGSEIGIVNSSGEIIHAREEGEIVVRGDAVFSGYYDDPEATRAAFHDGWFRTGDQGRLDQEGNLYVTGRLKEMINRGGEKILPGEVDAAFESHPAVLEAAAFAIPHPTLGEDVACAVVLRKGTDAQVNARELRHHAARYLASFKVPRRIHFVNEIPRGELGKPQRWVLTDQLSGCNAASATPAEITKLLVADPLVHNLHEIWARLLDREDLGMNEDFFEAGGDSLGTINMLAEVDQRFGSQTSSAAASFVDEPSLSHLAALVRDTLGPVSDREDSRNMQLFPVGTGGSGAQLFCVPPAGVEGLAFRRLARQFHGEMDLVIARPANTLYSNSLFTFERYGAETAALIRQIQPKGPYFVSGHCFGGLVAIEAARRLALQGQHVRVILYDVPLLGTSSLLPDWRGWLEGAKRQWHRLWTSKHPGIARNLRRFSCRLVLAALIPFRRFLAPVENAAVVRRIIGWSEIDEFPYYKAHPLDAPFLHILSPVAPSTLHAASRSYWRSIARGGIEEQYIALDNYNFFHESNLPLIAETLLKWCGVSPQTRDLNAHSIQEHRTVRAAH
jgi:acyl-CoA synthetase (AMP-forming)/AMP-acid ligase II